MKSQMHMDLFEIIDLNLVDFLLSVKHEKESVLVDVRKQHNQEIMH